MLRLLKLIIADSLGAIPETSKKDILCSREYQYLAQEAQRIEEEGQEIKGVIKEHLGDAYQRSEATDAEKLQKLLVGKNSLIQIERVNAKNSRLEAERTQKAIQALRDGTVSKEVLEAMMQEIPSQIITIDPNFLVVGYSQGTEKYTQLTVSRNAPYQRLFVTREGFEIFESAIRKLQPGERKEIFTTLGKKENPKNFISTVYPIYSGARLVGYGISIKPETLLHTLGRKFSTKKASELEMQVQEDILPEPGKA